MEKSETRLAGYQKIGLVLGPVLGLAVLLLEPAEGLTLEGWRVVGLALWMAAW